MPANLRLRWWKLPCPKQPCSRMRSILVTCLFLSGCTAGYAPDPKWVAELEKAGYDKTAIFMGGRAGQIHGIASREEAYALAQGQKGKTGSFVGYIWDVKLKGDTAIIEVIPNFSGESARRCVGESETYILGCMVQKRAVFTSSVTCHVKGWHALNDKTGGTIFTDTQTKWDRRASWNHVMVQGTISRAEDKAVKFDAWGSGGSFGLGGGYQEDGFIYSTIHAKRCRVLTFRSKAI